MMEKIRIGNYIYNRICEYSNEWIKCGKVVVGIDGEYIEWYL